jgi:hypothetical protein
MRSLLSTSHVLIAFLLSSCEIDPGHASFYTPVAFPIPPTAKHGLAAAQGLQPAPWCEATCRDLVTTAAASGERAFAADRDKNIPAPLKADDFTHCYFGEVAETGEARLICALFWKGRPVSLEPATIHVN